MGREGHNRREQAGIRRVTTGGQRWRKGFRTRLWGFGRTRFPADLRAWDENPPQEIAYGKAEDLRRLPQCGSSRPPALELRGHDGGLGHAAGRTARGLLLTLYADDLDDKGVLDELLVDGVVSFSEEEHCWVAAIDWAAIHHASDARVSSASRPDSGFSPPPVAQTTGLVAPADRPGVTPFRNVSSTRRGPPLNLARQITRDRKLTPEEAAKYRKIREEVELEKPEIIAKCSEPVVRHAANNSRR